MLSAYSLDMLVHQKGFEFALYFCACNKSGFTFYFRVYFCSGCAIYNFVKATFDLEKLNGKI